MGKCAVVGCKDIHVDAEKRTFSVDSTTVSEGDWITLDGATGRVFVGDLPTIPSEIVRVTNGSLPASRAPMYQSFSSVLELGRRSASSSRPCERRHAEGRARRASVRRRGHRALSHGAHVLRGRSHHGDARDDRRARRVGRRRALRSCCRCSARISRGSSRRWRLPRDHPLLDPPLHEFLPHGGEESKLLARTLGMTRDELNRVVESLRETNPMLGHRGCRLGITYPEITEMQARAIFEAAVRVSRRGNRRSAGDHGTARGHAREFENQRAIIEDVARQVLGAMGEDVPYLIGTMIELPRAALTADEIAATAQFFSFGTNDLTQTTFGLSRDDAGRFLPFYVEKGILPDDPFRVLDANGVGKLVRMAVEDGRRVRPNLKVGICGEHGGEPRSVTLCHQLGLDYVSCSPFRVPVARLAAAQAALAGT
jgi:pyruvate,orthophosphate dikinase